MILTCYLYGIYYFASFTVYEDDIFEVISNFHIQEFKFDGKIYKFGGQSKKRLISAEFMEFIFSMSDLMGFQKKGSGPLLENVQKKQPFLMIASHSPKVYNIF